MELNSDQKIGNNNKTTLWSLLPYLIAFIGISTSIVAWFEFTATKTLSSLPILPWVILINGILITLLAALAIRLGQLSKERFTTLSRIDHDFQQEVAEHVKSEEMKKNLEIALLQGQKLQAIGTLAGGIAHDFNNILYAIKGYIEMARDDVTKDTIVYNNLGKVLDATQRGQDLVARILAFSRRHQQVEFTPLEINQTLENVLSLLNPTIPSSVTINLICSPNKLYILGNQTLLHQVIVNIINNAVDAMDGEGVITLQVHHAVMDNPILNSQKILNCNHCRIDISDTGHGIEQNIVNRIFEPFFTTKEVGKGTGLGLSTVHTIIEQHQGEIAVKSQLGQGTTFSLFFPEYQLTTTKLEDDNGDYSFSRR